MKKLLKNIVRFFNNIRGFLGGWWQLYVSQKDIIYSFYGFNHFAFAKKYADRRCRRNGLKHWVVPSGRGSEQLIVFNTREKDSMQARGFMSRRVKAYDLMKASYHTSVQQPKKKK